MPKSKRSDAVAEKTAHVQPSKK